jgi:hypothetical protein
VAELPIHIIVGLLVAVIVGPVIGVIDIVEVLLQAPEVPVTV